MPATTYTLSVDLKQLPPGWEGDATSLTGWLQANLTVKNPSGYNSFVIGPTAPTEDLGPWLNGMEWWIWDAAVKKYQPVHVDSSLPIDFPTVTSLPASPTASRLCYLIAAAGSGLLSGVYWWDVEAKAWKHGSAGFADGDRPPEYPAYTPFFDESIGTWIYRNEQGQWSTMGGCVGDLKYVTFATYKEALRVNPGWEIEEDFPNYALAGADPEGVNWLENGYPSKEYAKTPTGTTGGSFTHQLVEDENGPHWHFLIKSNVGNGLYFPGTVSNVTLHGDVKHSGKCEPFPFYTVNECDDRNYTLCPSSLPAAAGKCLAEPRGREVADKHNNTQPTWYLIRMRKAF